MIIKKQYLKNAGIGLLVLLVLIQFFRPERNLGNDTTNHISKKFAVPDSVHEILKTACYDCHSNSTVYPWYTNIQPVGWWMQNHINEGKQRLNFSEFSAYRIYRQYDKVEETIKLVKEEEMPLPSYTWIHRNAILDENQKRQLSDWAAGIRDTIKANYPADSLVNPRKKSRQ